MRNGYFQLALGALQNQLAYRSAVWTWYLDLGMRLYLLIVFWTAIYAGRDSVDGVTLPSMITYAVLSTLQNHLLRTAVHNIVQRKIRAGQIVVDLLRPYGFLRSHFAAEVGRLVWNFISATPLIVILVIFFPIQAPSSLAIGVIYFVAIILSFALSFLLRSILAIVAFWTLELRGFNMIAELLISFLAGGFVPMWLLPNALQQLSNFLPFQSLIYLPLGIYIGKINGADIGFALLQQTIWLVILWGLVLWFWKITERKIVVQGG